MEPRREPPLRTQRRASLFLVSLLLISLIPVIASPVLADESGRDAQIQLSVTPSSQTVNPGETAEYTVRVYNRGSNSVSINLAANNEQDCNGYSSSIGQISQPIDANDYAETFLNVTLAQNAGGNCTTTVTANANEQPTPPDQPGSPAQEQSTVDTTAGDGESSAIFGVDLTVDTPHKTWGGESSLDWDVEVENTGRTQETIDLTIETIGGSGCAGSNTMSVSVDPSQVQIDNDSSEWVVVTVDVPDGQAADTFCWEITGVVTNDQNPNGSASDTESFDLEVPVLKECDIELSKTSINIDPGNTGTVIATFSNTGNSDWSLNVAFGGSNAGWAEVDGASSGMLPYSDGEGQKEFTVEITPDDSVEANSQSAITIQGKDGGIVKCNWDISVTVGQSHGATMSLGNTALYNIEPGQNTSTTLTVTNAGNGVDTFKISASSLPSGWSVSLESNTVSTQSRHTNDKSATIDVSVSLPLDALATEEVEITFSVGPNSGGAAYSTQTLTVTVMAIHGMSGDAPAEDQTGRSDTTVQFPISIANEGNTEDRFRFSVISQTTNPGWSSHFETVDGDVMTEVDIDARAAITMYLVVSIDGVEELDSSRLTVRVTNTGDNNNGDENEDGVPDNQVEFMFRAILSDRDFAMDALIMFENEVTRDDLLVLPPGGSSTYTIKVFNTGDGTDEAIFDFNGLSGTATRTLYYQGLEVDGAIKIPKGFGAMDKITGEFYFDDNGPMIGSTDDKIVEKMIAEGLMETHESVVYYAVFTLEIAVNPGAENGDGGLLEMVVTSVSNSVNRSGRVSISLSIETVMKLSLVLEGDSERDITFGEIGANSKFKTNLTNSGNIVTEVKIFSSGNMRGWSIHLTSNGSCENNGDHLICTIKEGESILVTAKVTPPGGDIAEVEDSFTFTLSVEPVDVGLVGRENLEMTVNGAPAEFGLNGLMTPTVLSGMGGIILLGLLVMAWRGRR